MGTIKPPLNLPQPPHLSQSSQLNAASKLEPLPKRSSYTNQICPPWQAPTKSSTTSKPALLNPAPAAPPCPPSSINSPKSKHPPSQPPSKSQPPNAFYQSNSGLSSTRPTTPLPPTK